MNIELKNIKHNERMSQETNAFTAAIVIDGDYVGECSNSGCGGPTNYNHNIFFPETKQVIEEAEKYCASLPPIPLDEYGLPPMAMTLEMRLDQLIEEYLKVKDNTRMKNKFNRAMLNCVIWGIPGDYTSFSFVRFRAPISVLLQHQSGIVALKEVINKYRPNLTEGQQFLNTNLTPEILKSGL